LLKKSEPELEIKLCIGLPPFKICSFTFYNKFVEIYKLLPCKTADYIKRQKKSKIIFEKFAFYGLDMELKPEPEP
jgi:hypothetical protein